MPTTAPSIEATASPRFERSSPVADIRDARLPARRAVLEHPSARPRAVPASRGADAALPATGVTHDLASRIQRLIEIEGGAAAIARRCGFSEGTVRNWRDGRGDLSRARCVTLARALDISLLWLVAGEGAMKPGAGEPVAAAPASPAALAPAAARPPRIDPQRLADTLKLLQSYICLAGGSLSPAQRADVVAELYELLGDDGDPRDIDRIVAFHHKLGAHLRGGRTALI